MSYKVTKSNEPYVYEAPLHYTCLATRLHDPQDVNEGKLVNGITHFLPGGGIEKAGNPNESIYYVLEGEMTIYIDGKEIVLHEGDSIHFGPFTERSAKNTGSKSARMMAIILPAQS